MNETTCSLKPTHCSRPLCAFSYIRLGQRPWNVRIQFQPSASSELKASLYRLVYIDVFSMAESKSKSLVWRHFTLVNPTSAQCDLCKKSFKRALGSTTNLIAHLARDHRKEHQSMREDDQRRKAETDAAQQVRNLRSSQISDRICRCRLQLQC